MSRLLFTTAFLLGAAAVAWMGSSFLGVSSLGFGVVAVIGVVYAIGFIELLQFRQATATLSHALLATAVPAAGKITVLDEWLKTLHSSLSNAVRLRIEGERVALPNPVLTPYLVSLLVMLGLLGTFAGMVDTLKGAVIALEGSTQLEAIRAGLTAPIGGLSLAFGTSVAGVAASAMLGLMSTLSRRDRMLSARLLDSHILGVFREFSLTHQRQETWKALQIQAQGLPEATEKLHALASQVARMSEHIEAKLLANQEHFHASATASYQELAASVGQSLRESLAESGRLAGESLKPIMQQAMTAISAEVSTATQSTCELLTITAQTTNEQLTQTAQVTCEQLTRTAQMTYEYLTNTTQTTYEHLTNAAQEHLEQLTHTAQTQLQAFNGQFQNSSTTVVTAMAAELRQVTANQQTSIQQLTERFEQLATTLKTELSSLRETEEHRGTAAIERLAELESAVAVHLATLGKALEDPMTRLIQTAAEAPRAAAEVISQLRSEISKNIERDNQLLEERLQTMAELHTLSASLESELGRLAGMTDLMVGSTVDMASLGEAFGVAVNLYSESNQKLIDSLDRIEGSLVNSTLRSDEQLGYYVAQAREVIDHSILSQKEIFEEIRHLGQKSMAEAVN
jgi:hypothetical protein